MPVGTDSMIHGKEQSLARIANCTALPRVTAGLTDGFSGALVEIKILETLWERKIRAVSLFLASAMAHCHKVVLSLAG